MQWLKNLWYRIKTLFSANANAALDSAEDPVKMADEYIRQLTAQYEEAKKATASAMASATRLAQKREQNREQADQWERNAMGALKRQDETLARSALERKRTYAAAASEYAVQAEIQEAQVKDFRAAITRLEGQIGEAKAKRDLIKTKAGRARSQETYTRAMQNVTGSTALGDRLGAMEEKIDDRLYKAEAMAKLEGDSLESRLSNLESDTAVESELAQLKAKMGSSQASS
jgi:phage shock protein A